MITRILARIAAFFRANFLAGLFIAVPFAITMVFLAWLWARIQGPLARVFDIAAGPEDTPWSGIFIAIESSDYSKLFVPLISLGILMCAVLLLGIVTRSIIGRMALLGVEGVVSRVPIVGMLYMSLKQLGEAFITAEGHSKFERAVAVQFPYKGSWAIGFVTGKAAGFLPAAASPPPAPGAELLTIFVPTTPLPTAGFMIVVPENETLKLEMSVQDALKLVVSGGIINPGDSHRIRPESEVTKIVRRETIERLKLKSGSGKSDD
jgi:uncharacterized membrane protein